MPETINNEIRTYSELDMRHIKKNNLKRAARAKKNGSKRTYSRVSRSRGRRGFNFFEEIQMEAI